MSENVIFEKVNPQSAGIDIGSEKIFVSTTGEDCLTYETFTRDYLQCINDLKEKGIKRVAMEATGVYWIGLYDLMEKAGIEVCLVNPKETRQVKGRKTDVKDCQWIQKMFSAGLLRQSYIPAGPLKELRMLVRERQDLIEMGSTYINKMQKYLELMNIKLTNVLSQTRGKSSLRIIEAIISGERNPEKLLKLCDKRIINSKSEKVLKALEANYNPTFIFMLQQNLMLWKIHEEQILNIDKKIEEVLCQLENGKEEIDDIGPEKPIRHHRPHIDDLHKKLTKIYGVDLNPIPGINDYTLLRLLGEIGTDMSRFPNKKNFVSWCQLSPGWNQSGKISKKPKIKSGSKAGQIFREVAQGLINSKYIAIGAFMRRLRSKKGPSIAIKAGARKIAEALYNLLTHGAGYIEQGVKNYEEQLKLREFKSLKIIAKKFNINITENQYIK